MTKLNSEEVKKELRKNKVRKLRIDSKLKKLREMIETYTSSGRIELALYLLMRQVEKKYSSELFLNERKRREAQNNDTHKHIKRNGAPGGYRTDKKSSGAR